MFDFDSPRVNYSNEICILIPFLAKWLSLSFDHTILRNMGGEGGLVAMQFFGYIKRQLLILILTNFLISKKYT